MGLERGIAKLILDVPTNDLISFYPLMAFTFFMAYIHSSSELSKLKKDNDKNGRTVTVLKKSENGTTRHQVKRGALQPGDIIEVIYLN